MDVGDLLVDVLVVQGSGWKYSGQLLSPDGAFVVISVEASKIAEGILVFISTNRFCIDDVSYIDVLMPGSR